MEPNKTIAVADLTAFNQLPRAQRPREWLLDAGRALLAVRMNLTAAGAVAGGQQWQSRSRLRAVVTTIDVLRDELLALAVDADAAGKRHAAEQDARRAAEAAPVDR